MRGKDCQSRGIMPANGITPAYAGKSLPSDLSQLPPEDHPRLCGEKTSFSCPSASVVGSPPPMRGKGKACICGNHIARITPAYAGKRFWYEETPAQGQDHPRLCGEKTRQFLFASNFIGSPPPMRGKGSGRKTTFWCDRITPAYAGKR